MSDEILGDDFDDDYADDELEDLALNEREFLAESDVPTAEDLA